ncbi:MAG: SDR family oxidoreductase [Myxococcales bacterium]|nr:MAG: SDR family oxidoreductase [Myxococcales bacterium]
MNLHERTVIVIGGGSGIGWGAAQACLERGAHVVLAGRTASKLERALQTLQAGERGRYVSADITKEGDVSALFRGAERVDHVVVTAADLAYQPIVEFDVAAAQRALGSKLLGALLVAKHAAPRLPAHGSLTFTTGVASERPLPRGSLTATVNGGLHSFVRAAAIELAPIRVNALSPGWVDSELWDSIGVDKAAAFAQMAARLPVGRIATPADLGHAAVFLMESEMTTGAVLTVDGGHRFV